MDDFLADLLWVVVLHLFEYYSNCPLFGLEFSKTTILRRLTRKAQGRYKVNSHLISGG